jgi:hypothetical protein
MKWNAAIIYSVYKGRRERVDWKHYVDNIASLKKFWGFHSGDYEDCRLLGYKIPVRTSQETHYVSDTEPGRSMLCKILGLHGGDYEECRLLGCYAE